MFLFSNTFRLLRFIFLIFLFFNNEDIFANECIRKLKSDGHELITKNSFLRKWYFSKGINIYKTSFIGRDALYGTDLRGLYPKYLNGASFVSYLSSGEFAVGDKKFSCKENNVEFNCGPFTLIYGNSTSKNSPDLPESWNKSIENYFNRDTVLLNNKEYYAVGSNNKIPINLAVAYKEPYISQFQPELPEFPKLSRLDNLKVLNKKFYDQPYQNGGWFKSLSNCNENGVRFSFFLNMILIPVNEYYEYINNWNKDIAYKSVNIYGCWPNEDKNYCIKRIKNKVNVVSNLFKRKDVIPAAIRIDLTFPVKKIDLSF